MARTWAAHIAGRGDARMVGLVDVNVGNARAFNAEFGFGAWTAADYRSIFDHGPLDIVLNTTPPEFHHPITAMALAHGCHVFSEKPMAHTRAECHDLLAAARRSGRIFAVMQNRRYLESIRSCAALVRSGLIGKIGFICADYFMGRENMGGHYQRMDSPLLVDMAIHTFDEARFITGLSATSVQTCEFSHPGSDFVGKDSAVCLFGMEDDAVFSYRGCWSAPGANTPSQAAWRITGEKGTIIWDGEHYPYAELRGPEKDHYISVAGRVDGERVYHGRETYHGCLDAMFAAAITGSQPETSCVDNIQSMEMVFAAVESSRTGTRVAISRQTD
jgi:predicted dehydrogenase